MRSHFTFHFVGVFYRKAEHVNCYVGSSIFISEYFIWFPVLHISQHVEFIPSSVPLCQGISEENPESCHHNLEQKMLHCALTEVLKGQNSPLIYKKCGHSNLC